MKPQPVIVIVNADRWLDYKDGGEYRESKRLRNEGLGFVAITLPRKGTG